MDPDLRRYLDVTVTLLVTAVALLVAGTVTTGATTLLAAAGLWPFCFLVVSISLPAPEGARD